MAIKKIELCLGVVFREKLRDVKIKWVNVMLEIMIAFENINLIQISYLTDKKKLIWFESNSLL